MNLPEESLPPPQPAAEHQGQQSAPPDSTAVAPPVTGDIQQHPLPDSIQKMMELGTRGATPSVLMLLQGWTRDLTSELRDCRKQVDECRSAIEARSDELRSLERRNAILQTRLENRPVQDISLTLGGIVVGFGITIPNQSLAIAVSVVGALLLTVGWIASLRGNAA